MPTITLISSVFAFLLSHSHTRGAVLVNNPLLTQPGASLNASAPPSDQLPVCVNSFAHPNWTGAIDPIGCNDAYQSVRERVQENLQTPYNFYSRQAFPQRHHRPPRGWPLPQGSGSGTCAITIRMARDFDPASLPINDDTYFPTSGSLPFQSDTWELILATLDSLFTACALGGDAGWATAGRNIVVAYWGRDSVMNRDYGFRARVVLGLDDSSVVT